MGNQSRLQPPVVIVETGELAADDKHRQQQDAANGAEQGAEKPIHAAQYRHAHQLRYAPSQQATNDRMMANTRIRPNHICSSSELNQLEETSPTAGPKYSAAQIAINRAAIDIASLTKPRTRPTTTETSKATAMIMSMIGIGDVVSGQPGEGRVRRRESITGAAPPVLPGRPC